MNERTERAAERLADLLDAEQMLCKGEQRLQSILDAAHEAFVALDAEGLILNWNAEAERAFGWSRAEAVGRPFADLVLPPAAHTRYRRQLELLRESAADRPVGLTTQLRMLHRDGNEFPADLRLALHAADDTHLIHVFVRDLSDREQAARDRRRAEEELAYQRLHDSLTGLPNRTLLLDRLGHALSLARRRGTALAVLCVDLDRFKLINESLGHAAGDEVLLEVVERVREVLRASDTMAHTSEDGLARLAGDEFVVICEEVGSERDAVGVGERIADALSAPIAVGEQQIFVSTSVGIALAEPDATPESLLRDAGNARHRAKERGRARFELFDPALHARVADRLNQETELRQALERDELCVHYQPIVSVRDGEWVGAEALVRWNHPDRGVLLPADFLPLAEETGLIVPLGRWVMEHACAQAARWQSGVCRTRPYRVSVNLSGHQLLHDDVKAMTIESMEASELDPSRLAVEVTETVLLDDANDAASTLADLRATGVRVFLDDFGTGYSSLSYLHRLPLDAVKLDRAFVSGLDEQGSKQQIVGAVVQMARALHMTVVAEGVETAPQLERLRELGCHLVQGYHLARPMPADEMTAMLDPAGARGIAPSGRPLTQSGDGPDGATGR